MKTIKINLKQKPIFVEKTIDIIEFGKIPVKTVLILRSELALFNGSENRAQEYIDTITAGIIASTDILPEFLEKTLGEKEQGRVKEVFKNFNKTFEDTAKEISYFGSLILTNESEDKLKEALHNPEDEVAKDTFLGSLGDIIDNSEKNLIQEYKKANGYCLSVLEEII